MPAEQRAPTTTTVSRKARDAATAHSGYQRGNYVRSLQRSLYRAAKARHQRTFHLLYQHLWRDDVLWEAWLQVRNNGGAGGVDEQGIDAFEANVKVELAELKQQLRGGEYRPSPVRRVYIPKASGELRPLGIPTVRDRVVQAAIKLVIEPVVEPRFYEHSYGFRPRRSAHQAITLTGKLLNSGYQYVLDLDFRKYFDSVDHAKLLVVLRRHVSDGRMLRLTKQILKAPIMEPDGVLRRCRRGCPQGGPLSPLLANVFLDILDSWLARHTRYRDLVWVRYADDGLVLSRKPVEEIAAAIARIAGRMGLELHPDKTRIVNMGQVGASVDFLGYRLARRRARGSKGTALIVMPTPNASNRIRENLRKVIPVRGNRDAKQLAKRANAIVRGWVSYFQLANVRQPFRGIAAFTQQRLRRYLARQRRSPGRGTRRFTDRWLRESLGLLDAYRLFVSLRFPQPHAVERR